MKNSVLLLFIAASSACASFAQDARQPEIMVDPTPQVEEAAIDETVSPEIVEAPTRYPIETLAFVHKRGVRPCGECERDRREIADAKKFFPIHVVSLDTPEGRDLAREWGVYECGVFIMLRFDGNRRSSRALPVREILWGDSPTFTRGPGSIARAES
ncbi:MAG: hypothetical protein HUK22_08040 [Thermoguttaceae bacterium]|nr:hypothetical protein [Thermoguttaceae bacterium]